MNDQDWFKKFRRHPHGGCTLLVLGALSGMLGVLLGGALLSPP